MWNKQYVETYLEQALNDLEDQGFGDSERRQIYKAMEEKMRWAYEAGLADGKLEGVEATRSSFRWIW